MTLFSLFSFTIVVGAIFGIGPIFAPVPSAAAAVVVVVVFMTTNKEEKGTYSFVYIPIHAFSNMFGNK